MPQRETHPNSKYDRNFSFQTLSDVSSSTSTSTVQTDAARSFEVAKLQLQNVCPAKNQAQFQRKQEFGVD